MSGTSPVVATPMDRLQNHVTGSLLLNVIENTAKLNKKTTSSSSNSSEDLTALQNKVNQMSITVAQASADASEAKSKAQDASTKVSGIQTTVDNLTADVGTLSTDVVRKNPAEGALQIINGELKATDFKSGDISLKDLASGVVLNDALSPQTIKSNLTVNGNTTIGSTSVNANLTVNGAISASGNISTLGNITIKSGNDDSMVVSGKISTKNIYSTTSSSNPLISFDNSNNVNIAGKTIIGTTSNPFNLTVNGDLNLGNLSISYDSGVVTFSDANTMKSATITLQ